MHARLVLLAVVAAFAASMPAVAEQRPAAKPGTAEKEIDKSTPTVTKGGRKIDDWENPNKGVKGSKGPVQK